MKQLTISLFSVLLFGLILSSCNKRFSIAKRHYSKGYYFSHNHKVTAHPQKVNAVVKYSQNKNMNNVSLLTNSFTTTNHFDSISAPQVLLQNRKAQNEIPTTKWLHKKNVMPLVIGNKEKYAVGSSYAKKQSIKGAASEGRSLLWIIIVVLVVLWALGLISGGLGLGFLINLLLLIALILFILWLLRIV
jgi:Family of unknown function (DUF5670)